MIEICPTCPAIPTMATLIRRLIERGDEISEYDDQDEYLVDLTAKIDSLNSITCAKLVTCEKTLSVAAFIMTADTRLDLLKSIIPESCAEE